MPFGFGNQSKQRYFGSPYFNADGTRRGFEIENFELLIKQKYKEAEVEAELSEEEDPDEAEKLRKNQPSATN